MKKNTYNKVDRDSFWKKLDIFDLGGKLFEMYLAIYISETCSPWELPQEAGHGKRVSITGELQWCLLVFSSPHLTGHWQRASLSVLSEAPTKCSHRLLPNVPTDFYLMFLCTVSPFYFLILLPNVPTCCFYLMFLPNASI